MHTLHFRAFCLRVNVHVCRLPVLNDHCVMGCGRLLVEEQDAQNLSMQWRPPAPGR